MPATCYRSCEGMNGLVDKWMTGRMSLFAQNPAEAPLKRVLMKAPEDRSFRGDQVLNWLRCAC